MNYSPYLGFLLFMTKNAPYFFSYLSVEHPFSTVSDIAVVSCSYNVDYFEDALFSLFDVECPAFLEQAIVKRKAEYLAGRVCANSALEALNVSNQLVGCIDKLPQWPDFVCGSISHSHDLATSVVAFKKDWQGIGIDIEKILTAERGQKLLSTVVNLREQDFVTQDNLSIFITSAFSIKESLFKALYPITQTQFYFKDAEIIDWQADGQVVLKLLVDLSPKWKKDSLIYGVSQIVGDYVWTLVNVKDY